jgi:hypothetical protein
MWLAEGETAILLPKAEATHPPTETEEINMDNTENAVILPDDELLQKARENVRERRRIWQRVGLYLVAWIVLLIAQDTILTTFRFQSSHNLWAQEALDHLNRGRNELQLELNHLSRHFEHQWLLVEHYRDGAERPTFWAAGHVVSRGIDYLHDAAWAMQHTRHHYTPYVFFVLVGMMLVWGAWVAKSVYLYAKRHMNFQMPKWRERPGALEREYNRLKRRAEEEKE